MNKVIKKILRPLVTSFRKCQIIVLSRISPKSLANMLYKMQHHRNIDWSHPRDVDEKINWLKFYGDTSKWVELADKYRVRRYVEERGLGDMLVDFYGKWDRAEDIDWESLPTQFVMKTNNGSGDILVCRDKAKLDKTLFTDKFAKLLDKTFGLDEAELQYSKMKPCIIAEALLDSTQQPIESSSLIDYKIWSFNGQPAYVWVCFNRTPHSCEVKVYDLDWNEHPEYSVDTEHYRLTDQVVPRPVSLEKMLHAAAILSAGFPVVRVDLYEVNGKPYFGEMTFTPAGGYNFFYTEEFLNILGDKAIINS